MLAGCGFKPMYAEGPSGVQLDEVMRTVSISSIPGRVGQRLRNELIFGTTGGGHSAAPRYKLKIAIKESLQSTVVAKTGKSKAEAYQLKAAFELVRLEDKTVLLTGTSFGRAAFDKLDSTFADLRARRDAENRAARTVAEDIETRIAAALSREV